MNRTEKSLQSRRKIIDCAIKEFGEKSYNESSMNSICKIGNLSKGIIYHYFKDKDELYLVCVKECFDKLTQFIQSMHYEFHEFEKDMEHYMNLRHQFFCENPDYRNIFFYALLQPPKHLAEKIRAEKNEFDTVTIAFCKSSLSSVALKDSILPEEAFEYFLILLESLNSYYQNRLHSYQDFNSLINDHEIKIKQILKIILYGIAKENPIL